MIEQATRQPLAVVAITAPTTAGETTKEQVRAARRVARALLSLAYDGYCILAVVDAHAALQHGLIRDEEASNKLPNQPLDLCVGAAQATTSALLMRELQTVFRRESLPLDAVALSTQVLVSRQDPAFASPSLAIGPVYSAWRARELSKNMHWKVVEEGKESWRRLVATPHPLDIIGFNTLEGLLRQGTMVVTGAGIPTTLDEKDEWRGEEAVIDCRRSAALMAEQLEADLLVTLIESDHLYINRGHADQKRLQQVSKEQLRQYVDEGHFSDDRSVETTLSFLESGGENQAIITHPERLAAALADRDGTRIGIFTHQLNLFTVE